MKLLIKNIKQLVQVRENAPIKVSGVDMKILPIIENAWLAIEDGLIVEYGEMSTFPGITDWSNLEIIDASGKLVFPSWCDSHTHIVYAGTRETEFVDRINGLSYEEIAQRGGGILNSAEKLANTSEEELINSASIRIKEVIQQGTGAIEIKSGYGLSVEAELKILRAIKKLKELFEIPIKSTFLGAHAYPTAYKKNKAAYVDLVINEMLPKIAAEKLADYCDVFCEENYFSVEDTERILEAAKKHGLTPRVHANQMSKSGGVQVGVKVGAISVDHLEFVEDDEINALTNSITMPTILPGAAFFLSLPHPPVRKMIDAGLPLAIASDYNPGSCPSGNMSFMISIACVQYKMTPEEAINAATINSAYSLGISEMHGSITIGKKANLFITKEISSYAYIPYAFAMPQIETVIINGKIVV